jgi:hypothetical protein
LNVRKSDETIAWDFVLYTILFKGKSLSSEEGICFASRGKVGNTVSDEDDKWDLVLCALFVRYCSIFID